jgi:class 3 adenylate cyclase
MRYHEVLGLLYFKRKQFEPALKVFSDLKGLGSLFAKKYSVSAQIYVDQKRFDLAVNEYRDMAEAREDRIAEVITGLNQLLEIEPLCLEAYRALCDIYQKSGRISAVIHGFEAVLQKSRAPGRVLYSLAQLYRLSGDSAKSISLLRDHISASPGDPVLLVFLGMAVQEEQALREAASLYNQAIQLDAVHKDKYEPFLHAVRHEQAACSTALKQSLVAAVQRHDYQSACQSYDQLLLVTQPDRDDQRQMVDIGERTMRQLAAQGDMPACEAIYARLASMPAVDASLSEKLAHWREMLAAQQGAMATPQVAAAQGRSAEGDRAEVASQVSRGARPAMPQRTAPQGLVTMMFTDMQGFTDMTQRLGDRKGLDVLLTHNRILREQLRRNEGHEQDSAGDGFFSVFQSCRQAVACAVSLQRTLATYNAEHPEQPIRVRCGLSVGEPLQKDEDGGYYGRAVIEGARISAKANGGQIFVSELVQAMLRPSGDFEFRDVGAFELKGLPGQHKVYEVIW